jgi:Porin subfamily
LHDASGGYYGANGAVNLVNANPGGGVTNGHPPDRYGWAVAGGAKFNLQGGDAAGFNVCYTEGAPGFCGNNNTFTLYNSNSSVGLGWTADGIFGNGTQVELTRVWSALAFYEHIWNPKWRTSWFGGYVNIDYGSNATNLILQRTPGAFAACGVAAVGAAASTIQLNPGNSCSPDWDYWEVGSRTQWNPVGQLDIGLEVLYSKRNTAFKGNAIVPATGARPPVLVIDDQDVWSAMFRWQRNFYP